MVLFKKYVWLLLKVCSKLPSYQDHPTAYRALNVDISLGCVEVWGKPLPVTIFLSFTSLRIEKCQDFFERERHESDFDYSPAQNFSGTVARDIRLFSQFSPEKEEILIPCCCRLEVVCEPIYAGEFVIVQVREKETLGRDTILSMATVSSFTATPSTASASVLASENASRDVAIAKAVEEAVLSRNKSWLGKIPRRCAHDLLTVA